MISVVGFPELFTGPWNGSKRLMGLQATSDRAYGLKRLPIGDHLWQPVSCSIRAEVVFTLGRDLAIAVRDSIVRRVSRRGGARTRVSPMSLDWLQTHEIEYRKHRLEP
jgi:hypothetical protein